MAEIPAGPACDRELLVWERDALVNDEDTASSLLWRNRDGPADSNELATHAEQVAASGERIREIEEAMARVGCGTCLSYGCRIRAAQDAPDTKAA